MFLTFILGTQLTCKTIKPLTQKHKYVHIYPLPIKKSQKITL